MVTVLLRIGDLEHQQHPSFSLSLSYEASRRFPVGLEFLVEARQVKSG